MNIFVTNPLPGTAVKHLDDKRLIKMVLETCQILSTVMHLNGRNGPYKPTHKNHPCVKWASESLNNYTWLCMYFSAILTEYRYRFNKDHACSKFFDNFVSFSSFTRLPNIRTEMKFVNCTPFKDEPDVFRAYKLCLLDKWAKDKRPPKWTNRERPQFETELEISLNF